MADGGAPITARPRAPVLIDSRGRPLRANALYDAARYTRRTAGWSANSTGPNREIATDLQTLRNRHRDLARNNPWVRRAIQALVTNTIGPGIRCQWESAERQARWSRWWESTDCDADGRLTGYGIQALALRATVESGAALLRRRPRRPQDGLDIPLQLQLLEPDYIDHNKTEAIANGGYITQGIEFGPFGRRQAYWLRPEHPGDPTPRMTAGTSKRHPAEDFAHQYRIDRPGQVHGVPWGTGAMTRARMLDDYQDAQLERHRNAACYMAFRRIADPSLLNDEQTDAINAAVGEYQLSDRFEPGIMQDLPPGMDIEFAQPPQPENDKDFQIAILRAVAADYGIPYEVLTGDLSEVNFSSARMGWNEFARNIDHWRWQMIHPQILAPIERWYLEAEAIAGHDTTGARALWTAPSRTMVDKTREIKPLIEEIRAGLISLPEAIRQVGYDPVTLAQEQAEFIAVLDHLGLKVSSVPSHDANQQTLDANTQEAPNADQTNPD